MARLTHKYILSALAVPLAALVVAGCGIGSNSSTVRTPGGKATVNVSKTALGNVLVDAQGRTLYLFKKDAAGKSACFGECANDWPPVRITANPTVGGGLAAAKAMTTARQDGKPGVTYNGHPLYRFEGDHKPGDTTGEGVSAFGAKWYAVSPDGAQVSAGAATSSTTSGGGYGSGY